MAQKNSGKTGLDAPNTISRYGFMYMPYYKRAYFWESEEMFRKMILSGALVYLSRMPAYNVLLPSVCVCFAMFYTVHIIRTVPLLCFAYNICYL